MNDDDEGAQIRDVYAHFGLTIYLAQVLEHGLVLAMVYLDLIPSSRGKVKDNNDWAKRMDSFVDRHFENTLGRMIRDLGQVTQVPADLQNMFAHALERRNWLAHDYFRERAAEFISVKGRESMLRELKAAQHLFESTDDRLTAVMKPVLEKYGFTDERLKVEMELFVKKARDG